MRSSKTTEQHKSLYIHSDENIVIFCVIYGMSQEDSAVLRGKKGSLG
jgi:hypothetical protein